MDPVFEEIMEPQCLVFVEKGQWALPVCSFPGCLACFGGSTVLCFTVEFRATPSSCPSSAQTQLVEYGQAFL